jgi:hypothetical protein
MTLDNCDLAVLTSKLIYEELVKKPQNIVSAFQKTGIHPLSLTAVVERLPASQRKVHRPVTSPSQFQPPTALQQAATNDERPREATQEIVWQPALRTYHADGTTVCEPLATCSDPRKDAELFVAALRAIPQDPKRPIRDHFARGTAQALVTTYFQPRNAILKEHLKAKAAKRAEGNMRLDGGTYYTTEEYMNEIHSKQIAQKEKEWLAMAKKSKKRPAQVSAAPIAEAHIISMPPVARVMPVPAQNRREPRERAPTNSQLTTLSRRSAQVYDASELRPPYKKHRR